MKKGLSGVVATVLLTITCLIPGTVAAQESQQVKCIVEDDSGPLAGVNVYVKGTTNGTISDSQGVALINHVNAEDVIVFSFVGYTQQEVTVGKRTTLNILLQQDDMTLEDVVVVGYGTQKKVNLTGSVTQMKFNEAILSKPMTNVSSAENKLASYGLINLDEFDRLPASRMPQLKNLMQMEDLRVRRAYRRSAESLPRIASFIGTSNRRDLLTDLSGSRRFICVEVEHAIDCTTPIPRPALCSTAA